MMPDFKGRKDFPEVPDDKIKIGDYSGVNRLAVTDIYSPKAEPGLKDQIMEPIKGETNNYDSPILSQQPVIVLSDVEAESRLINAIDGYLGKDWKKDPMPTQRGKDPMPTQRGGKSFEEGWGRKKTDAAPPTGRQKAPITGRPPWVKNPNLTQPGDTNWGVEHSQRKPKDLTGTKPVGAESDGVEKLFGAKLGIPGMGILDASGEDEINRPTPREQDDSEKIAEQLLDSIVDVLQKNPSTQHIFADTDGKEVRKIIGDILGKVPIVGGLAEGILEENNQPGLLEDTDAFNTRMGKSGEIQKIIGDILGKVPIVGGLAEGILESDDESNNKIRKSADTLSRKWQMPSVTQAESLNRSLQTNKDADATPWSYQG